MNLPFLAAAALALAVLPSECSLIPHITYSLPMQSVSPTAFMTAGHFPQIMLAGNPQLGSLQPKQIELMPTAGSIMAVNKEASQALNLVDSHGARTCNLHTESMQIEKTLDGRWKVTQIQTINC